MNMLKRIHKAARYLWTGEIPLPEDGRPFHTDTFVLALVQSNLSEWAFRAACEDWNCGDWAMALENLDPKELDDDIAGTVNAFMAKHRPMEEGAQ